MIKTLEKISAEITNSFYHSLQNQFEIIKHIQTQAKKIAMQRTSAERIPDSFCTPHEITCQVPIALIPDTNLLEYFRKKV